jgi:hypothetical protein|tara:strand:+ start:350 stop:613 length:264 start_codon:yes stop_codon:yes gene_type:complete
MNSGYIIEYQDGKKIEADIRPVDLVGFERQFGVGFGVLADPKEARYEHAAYLAWLGAKRKGETDNFDDFLNKVDTIKEFSSDTPKAK